MKKPPSAPHPLRPALAPLPAPVRRARPTDAPALAALRAERDGDLSRGRRWAEQTLRRQRRAPDEHLLLVWDDGEVAGYGYATRFSPPADTPPHVAPAGWYLMGVRVLERRRRQGIAAAITSARIRWLRGRTDEIWYFTAAENHASIALHQAQGFRPTGRPCWFPGVLNVDTSMILYRARLDVIDDEP